MKNLERPSTIKTRFIPDNSPSPKADHIHALIRVETYSESNCRRRYKLATIANKTFIFPVIRYQDIKVEHGVLVRELINIFR